MAEPEKEGDREFAKEIEKNSEQLEKIRSEVGKLVVGQKAVVNSMLRGIISNGNILVEGVVGIGKTLLVRTIAVVMGCEFKRIQFTPDLLPSDIVGISTYEKERGFYVLKGPIFANFVLGDEINRAPPKVQSALLEGMAEKQVTVGKETFELPKPFFVMATQNPQEQLGTFPLPEAQIDRFMFKLSMEYPTIDEEQRILSSNINTATFESFDLKPILNPAEIMKMQERVKKVYLDKKVEKYIVSIIDATRNPEKYNIKLGKYLEWGASPRGSLNLFIGSKAEALIKGKSFVVPEYVRTIVHDVLRHRLTVNYEGQSEDIKSEDVIDEILDKVPLP
ncbi:MoxR family ATPase [Candidatus Woesearchaeota archaeon]|nr:MoxR family ATPase [Candidatus Woesearchaeota archaeon]